MTIIAPVNGILKGRYEPLAFVGIVAGVLIVPGEIDIVGNTALYCDTNGTPDRQFQIDAWLTGSGTILWHAFSSDQLEPTQAAARSIGVQLQLLETRNPPADYEDLIRAAVRGRAHALLVTMFPQSFRDRTTLTGLAIKNRLPTIFGLREYPAAGAVMSYGANIADMFRLAAVYVDKILKGAKPADLPIEQPTKFELVINLKIAKVLGVTVPNTLLAQADDVIE